MFDWMLPLFDQEGEIGSATGVEDAPVAEGGSDEQPQESQEAQETQAETSPNADPEIKDEKDFAAALKAREEQLRQQLEKEYGSKAKQAETNEQYLDRIARFHGYADHEAFLKAFEEAEREQMVKREAERLGLDEEVYRTVLQPLNEKLTQQEKTLKELQEREAMHKVNAEVAELKAKYPDFEQIEDKVFQFAIERGYRLEDAYILLTYQNKIASIQQQTEQQVLANVTGRDEKQVLPGRDKPTDTSFDISKASLAEIEALSERVKRGERIEL